MSEPDAVVVHLDDHRPHITIGGANRVHVVPVALIESLIEGKLAFSDVEDQSMLQDVLSNWLKLIS